MCRVCAWRSIPPGILFIGHFLENTAILRDTGAGTVLEKWRRFQANSACRRSPDQDQGALAIEEHMEMVVVVWRRKKAGTVNSKMKKIVVHSFEGESRQGWETLLNLAFVDAYDKKHVHDGIKWKPRPLKQVAVLGALVTQLASFPQKLPCINHSVESKSDRQLLLFIDLRFKVEVTWRNFYLQTKQVGLELS